MAKPSQPQPKSHPKPAHKSAHKSAPTSATSFEVWGDEGYQLKQGGSTRIKLLFAIVIPKQWIAWYLFTENLAPVKQKPFKDEAEKMVASGPKYCSRTDSGCEIDRRQNIPTFNKRLEFAAGPFQSTTLKTGKPHEIGDFSTMSYKAHLVSGTSRTKQLKNKGDTQIIDLLLRLQPAKDATSFDLTLKMLKGDSLDKDDLDHLHGEVILIKLEPYKDSIEYTGNRFRQFYLDDSQ